MSHCLLTDFPLPSHWLPTAFLLTSHCFFTDFPLTSHWLPLASHCFSLPSHWLPTASHCFFTDFPLPSHWFPTASHCLLTDFPLPSHWFPTAFSLPSHCLPLPSHCLVLPFRLLPSLLIDFSLPFPLKFCLTSSTVFPMISHCHLKILKILTPPPFSLPAYCTSCFLNFVVHYSSFFPFSSN